MSYATVWYFTGIRINGKQNIILSVWLACFSVKRIIKTTIYYWFAAWSQNLCLPKKGHLFTLGNWFSTSANGAEHSNMRNKYYKLNTTRLKIPTDRRRTSCLFTSVAEYVVELGSTVKQRQLMVRTGLEPWTPGFQVRRPNHSAMLPPYTSNLPKPKVTRPSRNCVKDFSQI